MRTVFLNDEPRAIAGDAALHRVAAGMRQAGIAALPVYEHATADGFALVRVPLWLFAGEGAQRPQLRREDLRCTHISTHTEVTRSSDRRTRIRAGGTSNATMQTARRTTKARVRRRTR